MEKTRFVTGSATLKPRPVDGVLHKPLALALYKGGDNCAAHRRAAETLRIYHDLLKMLEIKSSLGELNHPADEDVAIPDLLKSGAGNKVQQVMALMIGAAFGFWGAKRWDKFRGA